MSTETKNKNKNKSSDRSSPSNRSRSKLSSKTNEEDEEEDIDEDIMPRRENSIQVCPSTHNIIAAVTFHDGYIFRQLMHFLESNFECVPMCFTENGIFLSGGNDINSLVCKNFFDKNELLEYKLDMEKINDPVNGCHMININLKEYYNQIKGIAKKESISLCQYEKRQDIVFITSYGGNDTNDGYDILKTEDFTNKCYDTTEVDSIQEANSKTTLLSFALACKKSAKIKRVNSTFKLSKTNCKIISKNEVGTTSSIADWGFCKRKKTVVFYETLVNSKILKKLEKISNLNTNGVIRMYCNSDGIIRLETKLGTMGHTCIYLIDPTVIDIK